MKKRKDIEVPALNSISEILQKKSGPEMKDIASQADVSLTALYDIQHKRRNPSIEFLTCVAGVLNLQIVAMPKGE